jgi:hypothetical protein
MFGANTWKYVKNDQHSKKEKVLFFRLTIDEQFCSEMEKDLDDNPFSTKEVSLLSCRVTSLKFWNIIARLEPCDIKVVWETVYTDKEPMWKKHIIALCTMIQRNTFVSFLTLNFCISRKTFDDVFTHLIQLKVIRNFFPQMVYNLFQMVLNFSKWFII